MCTSGQQGLLQTGTKVAGRKPGPPRTTGSGLEELQRLVRVLHEAVAGNGLGPPMHCLPAAMPRRYRGEGANGPKEGGRARIGMRAALASLQGHGNPRTPTMHGGTQGAVSA